MKLRVGLTLLATMVLGGMLLCGVVLAKNKNGDSNPNTLMGTNGTDYIRGKGGGDDIGGKKSRDYLWGNMGNDLLHGGDGHDRVHGDKGDNDVVYGDAGNDKLWAEIEHKGSFQAAKVKGGRKPDRLLGGRGSDTIRARDGNRDIIRGGPSYDKAYVDRVDKVTGVEKEVVPGGGGGGPQQPKQCADGKDNDGDQQIDMQDPGCAKATDDTEKNQPPVANKDSYSVYNDEHLTVTDSAKGVLSNDTDADNPNKTNAGLTVKDANPNTPEIDPVNGPTEGDLTLNTDGTFEYNHTGDCSSQPACIPPADSFTYKATDGAADSNVATVKITVCDINDPNNPPRCTKSPPPPPP